MTAKPPTCPKCQGPIYLTAPRISVNLWTCDRCGMVYPERDDAEAPLSRCDEPARYDLRASGNIWDGEGP